MQPHDAAAADGQPASPLSTPHQPGDVPIYEYDHDTGLAYRIGFKRRVSWRGSRSAISYETWIFSLCRTVARAAAKTETKITVEAHGPDDTTQPGEILLIVKHAPQPIDTRARGARGSGNGSQVTLAPHLIPA